MMPEIVKKDMELSNYCMGGISNHPTFRPYEYWNNQGFGDPMVSGVALADDSSGDFESWDPSLISQLNS